jgi:hypothetical protein
MPCGIRSDIGVGTGHSLTFMSALKAATFNLLLFHSRRITSTDVITSRPHLTACRRRGLLLLIL